jgi:hypothetical protein
MSVDLPVATSRGWKAPVATVVCTLVVAVGLTWTFFAMRAVMHVGGSCASGGPYVSAQPCPDGAVLMAVAIPAMLIAAIAGSAAAMSVGAPNLLLPMWGALFGSLGWNFLEFALAGPGVVWGWLVCGVLFWLMAAPAVLGMLVVVRNAILPPDPAPPGTGSRWWVSAYVALGAVGFLVGAWSFAALS